jgi:hypothetical protein
VHWYKTASATLTDLPTEPRHSSEDNHIIFSEVVLIATISFALTTFYRGKVFTAVPSDRARTLGPPSAAACFTMGGLTSAITRVVDSTGHTAPAAMFKAVHVVMGFQLYFARPHKFSG